MKVKAKEKNKKKNLNMKMSNTMNNEGHLLSSASANGNIFQ